MTTAPRERVPVIVLGGDTTALSVARSLGRRGVDVYGVGVAAWVGASRHLTALPVTVPAGTRPEDAWAQLLLGPDLPTELHGAVVLAGSDVGLTTLIRHRERLLERFRLDASDPPAQLAMLDKLATYRRAREADVATPLFWEVDDPADLERHRCELVYPLIVKPLLSHEFKARFPGIRKFRLVEDWAGLEQAHRELHEAGVAVMLVEQIPGTDEQLISYATYLDAAGDPTYDFVKRVIRRFPPGEGLACHHVTVHATAEAREVKELALRLFKHIGLRGVAHVEFIRDLRDGRLKLVECNARFSAADPLPTAAGLDLPLHVYSRVLGRPHAMPARYPDGLHMIYPTDDLRSFLALRRQGRLTTGTWLRSLAHRQVFPVLRLRDPAPAAARVWSRVGKSAGKLTGRVGARLRRR
jgi:predicted ATP-grasp superfamily ATP-dependent carboligase